MQQLPDWNGSCDVASLNERLRKAGEQFDYWTAEETKTALLGAPLRIEKDGPLEVQISGKWFQLCRTDLKDDVRTGGYDSSRRIYGARVTKDTIFVIDRWSDG